MKINKKNPKHWYRLIKLLIFLILLTPFRRFLKRKSHHKSVVLYGHKLHGNLLSIYSNTCTYKSQDTEIYFLTLDDSYERQIKNKKNILGLNFKDIKKVVSADCIISDHGLHFLVVLLYLTDIRFVDVWHGIPFKGFVPSDFNIQRKYDEIWVSSSYLKKIYTEKFCFSKQRVHITGYGRCDLLIDYNKKKESIKELYKLDAGKKIILFAPTWKQDTKSRNEMPFGYTEKEFIDALNKFLEKNNSTILLRYHLNSSNSIAIDNSIFKSLPSDKYPNTEEIIAISDILITDWSSIAFDMMVLHKPIVFIDTEAPFKNGFSVPPNYRPGYLANSLYDLKNALEQAINNETDYMKTHSETYNRVVQDVYDNTLDGKSSIRYIERLNFLLGLN